MAVLDEVLTAQLRDYLTRITQPIVLGLSGDESATSHRMEQLLNEVAACSELVSVQHRQDNARRPSFTIERANTSTHGEIRFAGVPLGHEFSSLVLALLQVGGVPVKEDAAVIEAVQGLSGDYHFVTYMSLSCQNCPTVVQALNAMAVLNPRIHHTAVEGSAFPDEVSEREVRTVPTLYLNDQPFGQGRMELAEILGKLDTEAASRASEQLNDTDPFEVLVVGGGPAGVAAAIYTARKGVRTGIVAERLGGQVLDTDLIENLIGTPTTHGPQLAASLEDHLRRYDVQVIKNQQAKALHPAAEPSGHHQVELASGASLSARSIILATGARWRTIGVPGEQEYLMKGVTFCPHCDGPLFKGKPVAVIGGGNSGIEAAIDLAGVASHVTVVEFLDVLKADDVLLRSLNAKPNVTLITNAATSAVVGNGEHVTGLDYTDRATGQHHHLDLEGVFVQIGLVPNTAWLGEAVELSATKEIATDARGATSVPGVFAAGDCTTVAYKQIVIAMGAGATAGLTAFDYLVRLDGSQ